ncbi:MAG: prepilin-type N-terminal cleavage/methylation domain-containing protein [Planctomycetaceae bacterium]|nr:prepilin-type N-terminal cleavage/methylation domain-containing protein [Planctomycetaceae bacterium]
MKVSRPTSIAPRRSRHCRRTVSSYSMRMVRDRASGFALVEVLVAIALVSLLMAAVYSAMSVYWTTATESFDEIERAQIARSLLREIARDIQSVTFVEQESTSSSEETDDEDVTVDADTALASYTNGLFGTSDDLVLYISRPDPSQSYISAQELLAPADRSSDSIIIRYLLSSAGGNGLSGLFAAQNTAASGSFSSDPVQGLAKMQGDLTGLSTAINQGNLDLQLAATSMLAPEVGAVSFQYFDGVDYFTEWDSTAQNAMPRAIVVELTLRSLPNPNSDKPIEQTPGYLPPTVHRLVVPIPVAKPYLEEMAF